MAEELKRFSVSVTPAMEEKLKQLKTSCYSNTTQSDMIRELILYGLNSIKYEKESEQKV